MVAAYAVTFDSETNLGIGTLNGLKGAVVWANSSADAKALLKAQYSSDMDYLWENATYTAIAAAANLLGWTLRIQVTTPATGAVIADCSVLGAGSDDTIDELAALMVIALNATAPIAGAAYNAGTQVLTIAETTDALGDKRVNAWMYPPNSLFVSIPGFLSTVVDEGAGSAALSITLAADSYTVPVVTKKFQG